MLVLFYYLSITTSEVAQLGRLWVDVGGIIRTRIRFGDDRLWLE